MPLIPFLLACRRRAKKSFASGNWKQILHHLSLIIRLKSDIWKAHHYSPGSLKLLPGGIYPPPVANPWCSGLQSSLLYPQIQAFDVSYPYSGIWDHKTKGVDSTCILHRLRHQATPFWWEEVNITFCALKARVICVSLLSEELSRFGKKHCGCSNQSGGAQLRIGGAWAPTKRYKVTPLASWQVMGPSIFQEQTDASISFHRLLCHHVSGTGPSSFDNNA